VKSKRTVLILDDVLEMREMLETLINGFEDYKVSGACGNCAEVRLELTRRRPSLVLLDEVLPGESSLDLLTELVAEGIPVVMMTGMEKATHEIPPGAALRITKPDWKTLERDGEKLHTVFDQVLNSAKTQKK
jgi:DNA-binding NtrC family response regulator